MKIFTALRRLVHRTQSATPVAPAPRPFDDGLVDLVRLIEVDEPDKAAPSPGARSKLDA
jgi:hypothetical protein